MAYASGQQPVLLWKERSKEHKSKFQRLQNLPSDQLEKIGNYVFCPKNEFKISGPNSDGAVIYIGLKKNGKEVAVKRMLTDHHSEHLAANEDEISNMIKMEKSKYVVRYFDYLKGDLFTHIVFELCEFSLEEYVRRVRDGNPIQFDPQDIIKKILSGLMVLHKRGNEEMILYRDLKPSSVLVDVEWDIRLGDFGDSKIVDEGACTRRMTGKYDGEWQAAESIRAYDESGKVFHKRKSDIQVAGMLAYYVLTKGKHPFGEITCDRRVNISDGKPVGLEALTDPMEKDFVSWLLQNNIDDRPFAHQALSHPFLFTIEDQFNFLVVMGDELEVKESMPCDIADELNSQSLIVYPGGWRAKIPEPVKKGMSKKGILYNSDNITRLLRFLRNVKVHLDDKSTPEVVRQHIKEPAQYFLHRDRFATLPMHVHRVLRNQARSVAESEKLWINRTALRPFFPIAEE